MKKNQKTITEEKATNQTEQKHKKINFLQKILINKKNKEVSGNSNSLVNLQGKDFLKLLDFSSKEISYLISLASEFKDEKINDIPHKLHKGKNIALIFEKTSTRTRCAFEVAAFDLGINVTYLDSNGSQIGKKESIADTARVLSSMYDGIEYRGYGQEIVEELAKYSKVPVWNGLTNEFHPTQILADFLTLKEKFGKLKGLNLTYMGDARYNMGNSLMVGAAKLGINFTVCSPKKYFPNAELIETCQQIAEKTGSKLTFTEDVKEGTTNSDAIYTDVWVSMGEPDEVWQERINDLSPYRVTKEVMSNAKSNAVFMHCLPSFHDLNTKIGKEINSKYGLTEMEVTDEVFESKNSVVFEQAENRMHTIKAVIAATI